MKPQDSKRLPPSLAALGEALNTLRAPTGPFDPAGEWEHRYSVWTLVPAPLGGGETQNPGGALRVRRKPGPDGTI
ncbi:hypothetical protein FJY63_02850, partial [Candidatus Sumerlaeota bacterium]|nr:hypothetical protein [Candidatus Sumerlaeota bacterium]